MTRAAAIALLALGLAACSGTSAKDAGSTDLGIGMPDAGGDIDSGLPDSGVDAGPIDGGLPVGTAPIGRSDMAFATDPDTKRVYMIDGDKALPVQCNPSPSDFVEDAWVFDPATKQWASIDTSGSQDKPLVRVRASGAWDAMRKRVIVFGGRYRQGTTGAYTFLKDVWALDPSTGTWTQLSPENNMQGPTGRMNATMVADPANDRVLIHAGGTTNGLSFAVNNDTWAFNLSDNTWHQLGMTGAPMPRIFHVSALDKMRKRLYVFSGAGADAFTAASFYQDMWYLDLTAGTWTQVPTTNGFPNGKIKASLDYDGARDRLVFFGGHDSQDVSNDVWTFDLSALTWTRKIAGDRITGMATGQCMFPASFATIDPMSPERREAQLFSIVGDQAVTFSGETDCGISNDTWILDLTSMTWTQINSSFSGLTCPRSGRTDCNQPNAQLCG